MTPTTIATNNPASSSPTTARSAARATSRACSISTGPFSLVLFAALWVRVCLHPLVCDIFLPPILLLYTGSCPCSGRCRRGVWRGTRGVRMKLSLGGVYICNVCATLAGACAFPLDPTPLRPRRVVAFSSYHLRIYTHIIYVDPWRCLFFLENSIPYVKVHRDLCRSPHILQGPSPTTTTTTKTTTTHNTDPALRAAVPLRPLAARGAQPLLREDRRCGRQQVRVFDCIVGSYY